MAATPREPSDAPVVAIDATPTLFPLTGIPRSVHETITALRGAGVPLVPYAVGLRSPLRRAVAPAGTRLVPLPVQGLLRLWARAEHPRLDVLLRGAEVLHATNFVTPPSRLPTVTTVHDCAFALHPETVTPVVRLFEGVLRRAADRGVTFHTPTRAVADDLRDVLGVEAVPIAWGVTPLPPSGPSPVDGPYVLAIGTVDPRKNLDVLVRAFGSVDVPGLRLVLAGADGLGTPALDAALAALPAARRSAVVRLGVVSEGDRVALLRGAAVLAYPSRYEGFGLPVLEAMSVGVPVVAGRSPAVAEVAGDAALLVDATDAEDLAAALTAAVGSQALADAGRTRSRAYTWEATATALASLYRSVVRR